ncbi:hypothetical protein KL910_001893 [Ogataea haglerorum]|nr:hypothetical protein KL910_001893 [Ogataea haglerorum]
MWMRAMIQMTQAIAASAPEQQPDHKRECRVPFPEIFCRRDSRAAGRGQAQRRGAEKPVDGCERVQRGQAFRRGCVAEPQGEV